MLIDSHAHLYAEVFQEDMAEVINRARFAGVGKIILPNIDLASLEPMMELRREYPDYCYPTIGLHPCSVKGDFKKVLRRMENYLDDPNIVGIGETGIDLYWDKSTAEIQREAFIWQINWAKQTGLPVIIHSRESIDWTIEEIEKAQNGNLSGIFHCFSGNTEQVMKIRDLGFFMGIGGVVTFKNGGLDKLLPQVGMENMLLETDSPYLAPAPWRGKRNEPAYVKKIAERVSEITKIPFEQIVEKTSSNSLKVFNKQILKINI